MGTHIKGQCVSRSRDGRKVLAQHTIWRSLVIVELYAFDAIGHGYAGRSRPNRLVTCGRPAGVV